jgi:hypothetical protein
LPVFFQAFNNTFIASPKHKMENYLPSFRVVYAILLWAASGFHSLQAQDLDPRAYIFLPTKTTTMISGFGYQYGGVVSDPTLPIQNIKADVQALSIGVARSFNLAGMTAQALVALPYSWAQVSGEVNEQNQRITRAGFADTRIRLSVLFVGAPASTLEQFKKTKPSKTIVGASINMVAPTGQFFSNKLINLGTNRWAFRPELALSQKVGTRWQLDVYAGVWLFTKNNSFYPGNVSRTQEPLGAFQTHFSYNFKPSMWVAVNSTFYTGGTSTLDGKVNDDRQSNMRVGITGVLPTGKFSSLKLAISKGAIVRIGQDFTSISLGWQRTWLH